MISRRRSLLIFAALLLILGGSIAMMLVVEGFRWRVQVVALKLGGGLVDLSWRELAGMLRPGSPYYLKPLLDNGNPYSAIRNPFVSAQDAEAGAELFRSQCGACHGATGEAGTGPSLVSGVFRHGDSDWALFRTITRGVPGTPMTGRALADRQVWQLVAFMRAVTSTSTGPHDRTDARVVEIPPVTDAILRAADEQPADWLMYSGSYTGQRHSRLVQINRETVRSLRLKWVYQLEPGSEPVETTPLVVGNTMFVTEPPSNVLALDAGTGKLQWTYRRTLSEPLSVCCQRTNRGVAIYGDRVYIGTLDAHLVALDARTGRASWDVEVAKPAEGYSITSAPLAVNGKIVIGVAGGEYGIRGFLDAYDAGTGKRIWRFYTVAGPGDPGHGSWSGDSWQVGGGPTWLTGSFDPTLNLVYWGVGNPGPTFQGDGRQGDNLYTNSVVALDGDTGRLRWYFQFTPHDEHDWDSNQIPVLVDRMTEGLPRKLMLWANRNGFYYVLDRETGALRRARPFVKQTWAKGLTPEGRPIVADGSVPSAKGTLVWPSVGGGTNWWSPSYSPVTDLFYVGAVEQAGVFFKGAEPTSRPGELVLGSASQRVTEAKTIIRALNAETGEHVWQYPFALGKRVSLSGVLSTAANVVFAGGRDDLFVALDAETGAELWRVELGGWIHAGPITFMKNDQQMVTISAGRNLFTFAAVP